jgi:hypothetical protein
MALVVLDARVSLQMSIKMRGGYEAFSTLTASVSFDAFVRNQMHVERACVEISFAANIAYERLVLEMKAKVSSEKRFVVEDFWARWTHERR